MLRSVRTLSASRLGAVLIALALTGAPRLAVQAAPEGAHHCTCKAHGPHDCTCPVCGAAAERARQAEEEKLPPCHRAAARAARAPARAPAGPCVAGSCGMPEEPRAGPAGVEVFTLSPQPPRTAPPLARLALRPAPTPAEVAAAPEPPPPRAA